MNEDKKYLGKDGKVYLYRNGNWYDDKYMLVCNSISAKLDKLLAEKPLELAVQKTEQAEDDLLPIQEIEKLKNERIDILVKFIDELIRNKKYQDSENIIRYLINNRNFNDVKILLPKLTSTQRKLGKSLIAAETAQKYIELYGSVILTYQLCSSAAAAYMDTNDYNEAKWYISKAIKLKSKNNTSDKLNNVIMRYNWEVHHNINDCNWYE